MILKYTPNVRQLRIALSRPLPEDQEVASIIIPPTLDSQQTPLPMINDVPFRIVFEHDTLGVILGYFPYRYRIYVKDIIPRISCSKIKVWENKLNGVCIVQIQNTPVVTMSDSGDLIDTSPELIQYNEITKIALYFSPEKQIQLQTI